MFDKIEEDLLEESKEEDDFGGALTAQQRLEQQVEIDMLKWGNTHSFYMHTSLLDVV